MNNFKYMDIYKDIRKKIDNQIYTTGEKLPDEFTLCEQFNCSRMTIKKALDLLVQEGIIYRKRGQGTFVMSQETESGTINIQERELHGLTKASHGKTTSKIISFKVEFAGDEIAKKLDIKNSDPIYEIIRLRLINNKPYVIEKTYMSTSLIPGITEDVLLGSIYQYIENTLHYKIASAKKTARAAISNDLDHQYLNLTNIEPVLEIEQVAYLDNGTPFEYSFSRHRYDVFEFSSFSIRR